MRKMKSVLPRLWLLSYKALPTLCLVFIICLTLAPTVFADGGGPQGGSNSGGAPPPPPPPASAGLIAFLLWLIHAMLGY